jgi:hopanoid biosynthesis associated RND transporter like protein HpnN
MVEPKTPIYVRLLRRWSDLVCDYPRVILALAGVLTVLSVLVSVVAVPVPFTALRLGPLTFQSDRNELISPKLAWNRRFVDWTRNFAGTADVYVVVDANSLGGADPAQQRLKAREFVDELGAALQARQDAVREVIWRFPSSEFAPRCVRLLPMKAEGRVGDTNFEAQLAQIAQAKTLLASATPWQMLGAVADQMRQADAAATAHDWGDQGIADELSNLGRLMDGFALRLQADSRTPGLGALVGDPAEAGAQWEYQETDNGRLAFVRVTPKLDHNAINALAPALESIRGVVAAVVARHPGVQVGITGIDVVESDETQAATSDSTLAAILAAGLIAVLLVVAFQSWRTPVLLMVSLGMAVAWAFGALTLLVGHLQVISIVFVVLLLGLGIAYGIYLASRFEMVRHGYADSPEGFKQAMRDSIVTMGPGTIVGSLTAAASFATTIFTDFRGVAEMGLISGLGLLLCLLAMFSVFPALLRLVKPGHRHVTPMESRYISFFQERWVMPFVRHPRVTLLVAGLLTAASLAAVGTMRFDYDLIKLQPKGMPSVDWQERIIRDGKESIYNGTILVAVRDGQGKIDPAATLQRAGELTAELYWMRDGQGRRVPRPTIAKVRGVGLLFPKDEARKLDMLRRLRAELEPDLTRAAERPQEGVEPANPLGAGLLLMGMQTALRAQSRGEVPQPIRAALTGLDGSITHLYQALVTLPVDQREARLAGLQHDYEQWRQDSARQIADALDTGPIQLADMPKELMRPYVAGDGRLALEVVPQVQDVGAHKVDSPLDPVFLHAFVTQMQQVDSGATGVVVQVYESGHLILTSYTKAGLWALAVVFLIVAAAFGSVIDTLMTMVPVVAGFAVTFGVMRLAGMQINAANIIVLPLMFGIGVDSGVQIIYRNRADPSGSPPGLTSGTGKGVTVTVLTSMIGFGTMMLARHRGIFSLGFVLTVGIGLTLLACWMVLPALLQLRRGRNGVLGNGSGRVGTTDAHR